MAVANWQSVLGHSQMIFLYDMLSYESMSVRRFHEFQGLNNAVLTHDVKSSASVLHDKT